MNISQVVLPQNSLVNRQKKLFNIKGLYAFYNLV